MFRKLQAIEIAEGALLADVAIVFHLLWLYLPIGGGLFLTLVFVVFTILVLRRGFYVGLMALIVAEFILIIITGFHGVSMLFVAGSGGIFLGITMRWRWHHLLLLLAGVTCGALALFALTALLTFLSGQSFDLIVVSLRTSYTWLTGLSGTLAAHVGLGGWWQQSASPALASMSEVAFRYWLLTWYALLWLTSWPVVAIIYAVTNALVRLFGYDVRPFPGGWLGRRLQRVRRFLIKWRSRSRVARWLKARGA
ncbi:MAG: DUF2232 domain-containing protein [Ktedonobacteraceae bacterium]|nr:DUF2232 domain-containing protein [Ktedonobacteraceae bacterium]